MHITIESSGSHCDRGIRVDQGQGSGCSSVLWRTRCHCAVTSPQRSRRHPRRIALLTACRGHLGTGDRARMSASWQRRSLYSRLVKTNASRGRRVRIVVVVRGMVWAGINSPGPNFRYRRAAPTLSRSQSLACRRSPRQAQPEHGARLPSPLLGQRTAQSWRCRVEQLLAMDIEFDAQMSTVA